MQVICEEKGTNIYMWRSERLKYNKHKQETDVDGSTVMLFSCFAQRNVTIVSHADDWDAQPLLDRDIILVFLGSGQFASVQVGKFLCSMFLVVNMHITYSLV